MRDTSPAPSRLALAPKRDSVEVTFGRRCGPARNAALFAPLPASSILLNHPCKPRSACIRRTSTSKCSGRDRRRRARGCARARRARSRRACARRRRRHVPWWRAVARAGPSVVDTEEAAVVICVTANLQLTGWLTAMQLDVTGFALLLEHEGVPRRDFADRDWDRAEQPYPLRGTPDAPRQGAVDIRMSSSSAHRGGRPAQMSKLVSRARVSPSCATTTAARH